MEGHCMISDQPTLLGHPALPQTEIPFRCYNRDIELNQRSSCLLGRECRLFWSRLRCANESPNMEYRVFRGWSSLPRSILCPTTRRIWEGIGVIGTCPIISPLSSGVSPCQSINQSRDHNSSRHLSCFGNKLSHALQLSFFHLINCTTTKKHARAHTHV